jgi:hypothetical protein
VRVECLRATYALARASSLPRSTESDARGDDEAAWRGEEHQWDQGSSGVDEAARSVIAGRDPVKLPPADDVWDAPAARSPQSEDHKHSWHPVWRCRHCGLVQPPAPSRDARGDDEAVRDDHDGHWTTTYHRCASCGAMTSAARSPQGEDHEAGIRAMLAEAEGRGLRMRTDDGAEVAAMDEADVRALAAAYRSRVSPSR